MDKLQVTLSHARARITRAVHKQIDCDNVTIEFSTWDIAIHAWGDKTNIIASIYAPKNATLKQVIQQVRAEV